MPTLAWWCPIEPRWAVTKLVHTMWCGFNLTYKDLGGKAWSANLRLCFFFFFLSGYQLVKTNSILWARIGPQCSWELRWLWPSVPWEGLSQLVSLIGSYIMPGQHTQLTPTSLSQGVCVFRCSPSVLLAEWLGSSMCHCSNTGVEWTPNKSQHRKLTLEKKTLPLLLMGFKLEIFRV